jgi:hypothetical protein
VGIERVLGVLMLPLLLAAAIAQVGASDNT